MMIGETARSTPTVQVPPWEPMDDKSFLMSSPFSFVTSINHGGGGGSATSPNGDNINSFPFDALTALQRYLPSNMNDVAVDSDVSMDAFSCDDFRMFEFKVRKCSHSRSHDWTECPYAHRGEKARRRDPRKFHYSGTACPEFRKGHCRKGDACEFAHGVFECWLHPARYRTQPCKDGIHCRRRVCFFAHTPDQLRFLPQTSPRSQVDSYDGSPSRLAFDSYDGSTTRFDMDSYSRKSSFESSPTSILYSPPVSPQSESPPMSPQCLNSVNGLSDAVRNLQIGKVRMSVSPPSWGVQMGSGICSPLSPYNLRPGFLSLPSTPTTTIARSGLGLSDLRHKSWVEEEPLMERVESGKDLRAKIYAKLSMENSLDRVGSISPGPDVGWVLELVK